MRNLYEKSIENYQSIITEDIHDMNSYTTINSQYQTTMHDVRSGLWQNNDIFGRKTIK